MTASRAGTGRCVDCGMQPKERDHINDHAGTEPRDPDRRDESERRIWAREVLVAVDGLDRRSAAALRLIYLRRATQAQVATRLGLSESEVRSVVADGLRALATRILAARTSPGNE